MWTPEEFLAHNRVLWAQSHEQLRLCNGAKLTDPLPYLLVTAMAVVQEERPSLFSSAVQPPAAARCVEAPVTSSSLDS